MERKDNVVALSGGAIEYDQSGEANANLVEHLEDLLQRAKAGEYCGGVLLVVDKRLRVSYRTIGEFCTSYTVVGGLHSVAQALTQRIIKITHNE